MKIVIFGAGGRVGEELVRLALRDKHEVTAFVRNKDALSHIEDTNLTRYVGDALLERDVRQCIHGKDMVFSALSTGNNQVLSKSIPSIVKGMEDAGITRLITIGTAGILNARTDPTIYRFQSAESKRMRTTAAEDHLQVYLYLKEASLNWTIFCPTYLPDGLATSNIRYEMDFLPEGGKRITVGDTALFAYKQKDNPVFFGRRVGLAE